MFDVWGFGVCVFFKNCGRSFEIVVDCVIVLVCVMDIFSVEVFDYYYMLGLEGKLLRNVFR